MLQRTPSASPHPKRRHSLWFALGLLGMPLLAQAAGVLPGEWEMQIQMNGVPPQVQQMMAAHPITYCMPAHQSLPPPTPGCRVLHHSQMGNTITETVACADAGHPMTARIRMVLAPDRRSYTAYQTLLDPPPGVPAASTRTVTHGKWIAAHCTSPAPGPAGSLPSYPSP